MFILYSSKASSALAPHILLHEVGATFELRDVPIAAAAHRQPAYLAINPKGRVPALQTPEGVLTENPAILEYIARSYPAAGLLPTTVFEQAQAQALSAYLCATMHVAFAHLQRGARWADDVQAHKAMQNKVGSNLADCARFLEDHCLGRSSESTPWFFGARYTYCDAYLFLAPRWLIKAGVSLEDFPKLLAHQNAMLARPATQSALAEQGMTEG